MSYRLLLSVCKHVSCLMRPVIIRARTGFDWILANFIAGDTHQSSWLLPRRKIQRPIEARHVQFPGVKIPRSSRVCPGQAPGRRPRAAEQSVRDLLTCGDFLTELWSRVACTVYVVRPLQNVTANRCLFLRSWCAYNSILGFLHASFSMAAYSCEGIFPHF